jgi:RNA-directed DNA polymerase
MAKNVLEINSSAAKKFLISEEAYSSIGLPPYYTFSNLLQKINTILAEKQLTFEELSKAKKFETINHILFGNKDGKYAWRKFELINPLMYLSLVNIITEESNWKFLQNRFKEFRSNPNIECESIPVLPIFRKKQKAVQISQWVNNIELKSIALSLEYKLLYTTDITDCYGSIYTHTLPWAIHTKETSKDKRGYNDLFGNQIDHHIQAMSFGQTNGIPQGSILMNFIAEIILGYADFLLSEKLAEVLNHKNYHILRYRDDYRIFVNDTNDGEAILKCISEVLSGLGFKLNAEKTSFCSDIVAGSIKKDKISNIELEDIPEKLSKAELIRQILITQKISTEFPNSGTLTRRLSKIHKVTKTNSFSGQQKLITSILIDIAFNSPNSFPLVAGLVSECIASLELKLRKDLIQKIQAKIANLTNIGLIEIWLQRISLGFNFSPKLNEKLCKVISDKSIKIFETGWIDDNSIKTLIDQNIYVNLNRLQKLKKVISKAEVQVFNPYEY